VILNTRVRCGAAGMAVLRRLLEGYSPKQVVEVKT